MRVRICGRALGDLGSVHAMRVIDRAEPLGEPRRAKRDARAHDDLVDQKEHEQRRLAVAIKRARHLALLPFVANN